MSADTQPFRVVIPVYEKVDLLDVAVPHEMFNWMGEVWEARPVEVRLAARSKRPLRTRDGMWLRPDVTFRGLAREGVRADLLWVPGGDPPALKELMSDRAYMRFLKEQSEHAAYVTSVCEGALLLASAGLLKGYTATTHWAFVQCLREMGVTVAPGHPRYFVDRNRVTGGGISSGLDESLQLIAMIAGEDVARRVQLYTQYFPAPPFTGTIPDSTDCPLNHIP